MNLPTKISTKRLYILPISDKKYLQDIFGNFTPEITKYMYPSSPKDISDTEKFLEDSIQKNLSGKDFGITVTDKNGEFIGNGGLHNIDTKTPEFGIWIKRDAHGKGYGLEVIQALKDWADKNLDYEYLNYPVDKDNLASRKIPELMGGKIEAEYKVTSMSGKILDCVEYRIYPNK